METVMKTVLQNREVAGRLLSEKLIDYKDTNSVVVGLSRGGVCVAAVIAETLRLPLDIILCAKIEHPADMKRNIGSVSEDEVFMQNYSHTIPQDYVYHQIRKLKSILISEHYYYYGKDSPVSVGNKTVILVDDFLDSADSILACLHSIRKQDPGKMIIAVPVTTKEVARMLRTEADALVALSITDHVDSGEDYFNDFPDVEQDHVKDLLRATRLKKQLC